MSNKRKEAKAAGGRTVEFNYTPLTDPEVAAQYAEALRDSYAFVIVKQIGDRLCVYASHRPIH